MAKRSTVDYDAKRSLFINRAINEGIDLTADVHSISISDKDTLHSLAKQYGYKKSPNSSTSLGSSFFLMLQKQYNKKA